MQQIYCLYANEMMCRCKQYFVSIQIKIVQLSNKCFDYDKKVAILRGFVITNRLNRLNKLK